MLSETGRHISVYRPRPTRHFRGAVPRIPQIALHIEMVQQQPRKFHHLNPN